MGRSLSFDEVKNYIEVKSESGCKLINTEYKNNSSKLEIQCKCGEIFFTSFAKFKDRNKRQCNKCSGIVNWNYELVKKYIEIDSNSDCKLLSSEYLNNKTKLKIKCRCRNEYIVDFTSFKDKKQQHCKQCSNITDWDLEKIREYSSNNGYILISDTYKNILTQIIIKDNNGYLYTVLFADFVRGYPPTRFGKSNKFTYNNINLWLSINKKTIQLVSSEYINAREKMLWKCTKNNCNEIFEMSWDCIQRGTGCPYCSGHKVGLSNCLATKNPKLAKEWNCEKNNDLTPYDFTCGYDTKKVWWKCPINPKHEWQATIGSRNNGCGCPYCSGYLPSEDYNLLVNNPKLCEEWDYDKNNIPPTEYCPTTNKSAWWICKNCGNSWQASINNRNKPNGNGCPKCNSSKGEKRIKEVLELNNCIFESEYTFPNLKGIGGGLLRFDFAIFNNFTKDNILTLIEFDGEQHFKWIKGMMSKNGFNTLQIHDKMKNKYCLEHNIKILRMPYWEFDNIENILEKELQL
jgi:hypothetical protein